MQRTFIRTLLKIILIITVPGYSDLLLLIVVQAVSAVAGLL